MSQAWLNISYAQRLTLLCSQSPSRAAPPGRNEICRGFVTPGLNTCVVKRWVGCFSLAGSSLAPAPTRADVYTGSGLGLLWHWCMLGKKGRVNKDGTWRAMHLARDAGVRLGALSCT